MDVWTLVSGVVGFGFGVLVGSLATRAVLATERLSRNLAKLADDQTKDDDDGQP